jgi:hypothetical protein
MVVLNYFADSDAGAPREETIPEPSDDKVTVFDEFFTIGLQMPPHHSLTENLLKFMTQFH